MQSNSTQKNRIKEFGEVFTPAYIVESMVEALFNALTIDPEMTWLEPSCGDGNFLVVIHDKLMDKLHEWQPDTTKLHQHIIENMLFGIDIMQDNVDACITRLRAEHLKHHIVCADALIYHYRFDEWDVDPEEPLFIWPKH